MHIQRINLFPQANMDWSHASGTSAAFDRIIRRIHRCQQSSTLTAALYVSIVLAVVSRQ